MHPTKGGFGTLSCHISLPLQSIISITTEPLHRMRGGGLLDIWRTSRKEADPTEEEERRIEHLLCAPEQEKWVLVLGVKQRVIESS